MRINEISDPHLRDRLVLPQPPSSGKKWLLIILVLIIGSLVIAGYFFPQKFYAIQAFFGKESPSEEVPILNPVIPESHKEPTAISTIPPVTESVNHSENTDTPVDTKPPVATENNTDAAPLATVTESVAVLMERAKDQLAKQRFTSPAGNNAYETSQQLAKGSPQQAQEIVNAIVDWYLEQGQRYLLDKERLLQPEQRNAFDMYRRAQEIAPNHPQVQKGIDKILRECYRIALNYQKSGRSVQGLKIVEKALLLRPQDPALLKLKEQLTNE